jgi:hypothetical protein
MNVFEDLIEELKEENLIEETVIETAKTEEMQALAVSAQAEVLVPAEVETVTEKTEVQPDEPAADDYQPQNLTDYPTPDPSVPENLNYFAEEPPMVEESTAEFMTEEQIPVISQANDFSASLPAEPSEFELPEDLSLKKIAEPETLPTIEFNDNQALQELMAEASLEEDGVIQYAEAISLNEAQPTEKDFYRRRATEEVNALQIVEHIISAIEREQMKMIPKPYDDIAVSMALHDFLKVADQPHSPEHSQSEFCLLQETESWYSALSHRDKHISIGDLRRYCENARPPLSGQALISLARFYRNSPFSEAVRNKFEVVVTRLLTKEVWDDTREMLLDRDGMMKQLSGLYADWSSIPLYEAENDSEVLIGVLKLEDFLHEAAESRTFEDLIKNDFFNRLRLFKESMGEKFFSPILIAAAIECNVTVGNKYIELLNQERERNNARLVQEKYSFVLDQPVSDATSKTLQLIELLKEKGEAPKPLVVEQKPEIKETLKLDQTTPRYQPIADQTKKKLLGLSRWVWIFCISLVLAFGGLVIYVELFTSPMKTSPSVRKVNLDNSSLKEYFKVARINRDTFFAVTEPAWDKLSKDVKEDVLKKTLAVGSEKGYNKIHLMNAEGKTVGFASEKGIDLDVK